MNLVNLDKLKNQKNLLAFSGGTDSSALFHLLIENQIDFDIAIVNYNTRDTSIQETEYALELVSDFNSKNSSKKICFTHSVKLESHSNFEMSARNVRYDFFHSLIKEHSYDNLITGHNLNDKMEWFLMRMTKGAGIKELFGMEPVSQKEIDSLKYTIVRPLISSSKDEIMEYLNNCNIKYFFDESNKDQSYTRNYFRANYVESLVNSYAQGIKRTFDILEKEVKSFEIELNFLEKDDVYAILSAKDNNFVYIADKFLKTIGYVMSSSQREDLSEDKEVMIDRTHVISYSNGKLFYTPYVQDMVMTKEFKEKMRKESVPIKNRPFFFFIGEEFRLK